MYKVELTLFRRAGYPLDRLWAGGYHVPGFESGVGVPSTSLWAGSPAS